jgi:hypothetical protein
MLRHRIINRSPVPQFNVVPLFGKDTWMATLDGKTFLGNYCPQDVMNGFMTQLVEKLPDGVFNIGNASALRQGHTIVVKHFDNRGSLKKIASQLEALVGL